MKNEIEFIIQSMREVLSGDPWYGKSVLTILNGINPGIVNQKPNKSSHSMLELLYHMVTWVEFTQHRLEKIQHTDMTAYEALDWRETNPEIHTWNNGISQFTGGTNKIIQLLTDGSDEILEEMVDYREYNFRYLLRGLIQHNIYHLGQIAYVNKMLTGM